MDRFLHISNWLTTGPLLLSLVWFSLACEAETEFDFPEEEEFAFARSPEGSVQEGEVLGEIHPKVVARVNDREIRRQDVEQRLDRLASLYRHTRRPFDDQIRETKREQVLQRLIDRELLRDHIERERITIAPELLDREMEARIDSRFGSSGAFQRYLESEGLSASDFRKDLRDELAIKNLLLDENAVEPIDSEALQEHYERIARRRPAGERVQASTLSLRVPTNADEATRQRIRESLQRSLDEIEAPEAFQSLAERIGQGANTAKLENLRWVERHQVHPRSAQILFHPDHPDGLTAIIDTPLGFEVFWVHDRRPPGVRGIDEVEELLRHRARQAHLEKRRRDLLQELRREASITLDADAFPDAP